MSTLEKDDDQSFSRFMREVKQQWKNSGIVMEVKNNMYYEPPISDNMQKRRAVEQKKKKEKEEFLRKMGKLKPKGFDKYGRRQS